MAPESAPGRFFRRLADFVDRLSTRGSYAGTRGEIDVVAFGLLFFGIIIAGTLIHGIAFLGWMFFFAGVITGSAWLVFRSAIWSGKKRAGLIALLLVVSCGTVAERLGALLLFITTTVFLLHGLLNKSALRANRLSVAAVTMLCFSAYDGFSLILAAQRNTLLTLPGKLPLYCSAGTASRVGCRAGSVEFDVPEFWQHGGKSRIAADLSAVADFQYYTDSGTENKITFAAFKERPERVMQGMTTFFSAQKSFLQSRDRAHGILTPQLVMRAADAELYHLAYESYSRPGYLAETVENNALILLHRKREVTWLFILDGNDFSGREFLLHRIISGFR